MATKKKSAKQAKTLAAHGTAVAAESGARPEAGVEPGEPGEGPTLKDVAEGYLAWLDKDHAGFGTVSSYGLELRTAMRELDDMTPVNELTPERVQEYFDSDAVTKTRSGKRKAKPTVDKTRRVLRLALVWAKEEGLIETAPIPQPKPAALKAL